MKNTSQHPLIAEYLRQVERSASSLTPEEQAELLKDLKAHFETALDESVSDEDVESAIRAMGSPDEIVESFGSPKPSKQGLASIALGATSLIALLAPPFGLIAGLLAIGALIASFVVLRDKQSTQIHRRRAFTGGGLAVISTLTIAVVFAFFIPKSSGSVGTVINLVPANPMALTNAQSFIQNGGRWCTADEIRAELLSKPDVGATSSAYVIVGNVSGSDCALKGPFTLQTKMGSNQYSIYDEDCPPANSGMNCAVTVLPASAPFSTIAESFDNSLFASLQLSSPLRDEGSGVCASGNLKNVSDMRLTIGDFVFELPNKPTLGTKQPLQTCGGSVSVIRSVMP